MLFKALYQSSNVLLHSITPVLSQWKLYGFTSLQMIGNLYAAASTIFNSLLYWLKLSSRNGAMQKSNNEYDCPYKSARVPRIVLNHYGLSSNPTPVIAFSQLCHSTASL